MYVDRPSGTLREFSENEPDSLQVLPEVNGNLFAAWNSKNRSVPGVALDVPVVKENIGHNVARCSRHRHAENSRGNVAATGF